MLLRTMLSHVLGADNGHYLPITLHVYRLLLQLHIRATFTKTWIDAMCIIQRDEVKKAHQAGRMHEIFADAWEVLVWPVKAKDNSDLAMKGILIQWKHARVAPKLITVPKSPMQNPAQITSNITAIAVLIRF